MSNSTKHLTGDYARFADVVKVSLAKARKEGLKYYWTDEPCKHGHRFFRYTKNQACVKCTQVHGRETRHVQRQTRREKLGIAVNGEVRRAIENKLLDLQLAREGAW